MNFKEEIDKRGLKLIWVAAQIGCKYSSFKVYINNIDIMPEWVQTKLKELLTT